MSEAMDEASWEAECKRHREALYGIAEALGMHVSRDEAGDMQMPCGSDILAELKERLVPDPVAELPTADELVNLLYSEGFRVNTPVALAIRIIELMEQHEKAPVFQVTADEFNRANKEYDRLSREAFKENGNQHGKGPSYGYCLNLELTKRLGAKP